MNEQLQYSEIERNMMLCAAKQLQPINGSMELLPLCNMDCRMCYVRLTGEEMVAQGGMLSGDEWLKLGKEMANAGTLFLLLTGGEPLLHPEFKKIYLGLRELGMIITVNTNATLITEQWAEFFGKNRPRRINVTLYGASNDTYESICRFPKGFDRTIEAVKLLREQGVDVRLGFGVTPENEKEIPVLYEIARELDTAVVTDTYIFPSVRERSRPFDQQSRLMPEKAARAHWSKVQLEMPREEFLRKGMWILNSIERFVPTNPKPCSGTCFAGRCSFAINWQGELRPCVMTTEPSVSVLETGFLKAWKQVSCMHLSTRFCSDCSVCALRLLCPVCPVAVKAETGTYDVKPEYLCCYANESYKILKKICLREIESCKQGKETD